MPQLRPRTRPGTRVGIRHRQERALRQPPTGGVRDPDAQQAGHAASDLRRRRA
jgi:hypothetical protein